MRRHRLSCYPLMSSKNAARTARCSGVNDTWTAADVANRIAAMRTFDPSALAEDFKALQDELDAVSMWIVESIDMDLPSTEGTDPVSYLDERLAWNEQHPEAQYREPSAVMMGVAVVALALVDLTANVIEAIGRRWKR